ncbi:MAG: hypothetical protein WCP00_00320 [bacterium]
MWLIVIIVAAISSGSQTDNSQSNNTNNTTNSNDNAQKLQSCIEDAQSVAQAAPTLDTTGPNETAAINACQAEFPTK